jgi:hypothetical protein
MKKIFKTLLLIMIIASVITPTFVYATEATANTEEKKQLLVLSNHEKAIFDMTQNSNIIEALPHVMIVYPTGGEADGTFTYPNYDNTRLGVWDLEWVFTPYDQTYEAVSGTIKLNVRAKDPEPIEEPTTPSLTATSVLLDTMTTYDINLDNKISGSTYRWTSSDVEVVDVNQRSGLLKAKKVGTAVITCEITFPDASKKKLTSNVTVGYDDNAPVLTETTLDLETGDVFDINLENKVAKSKYRWVSSDRAVVKVNSANGKVTAVSSGSAYVTCTITTPTNQVIVLRCDINVSESAVIIE